MERRVSRERETGPLASASLPPAPLPLTVPRTRRAPVPFNPHAPGLSGKITWVSERGKSNLLSRLFEPRQVLTPSSANPSGRITPCPQNGSAALISASVGGVCGCWIRRAEAPPALPRCSGSASRGLYISSERRERGSEARPPAVTPCDGQGSVTRSFG